MPNIILRVLFRCVSNKDKKFEILKDIFYSRGNASAPLPNTTKLNKTVDMRMLL
jgi:hypothetical protein